MLNIRMIDMPIQREAWGAPVISNLTNTPERGYQLKEWLAEWRCCQQYLAASQKYKSSIQEGCHAFWAP